MDNETEKNYSYKCPICKKNGGRKLDLTFINNGNKIFACLDCQAKKDEESRAYETKKERERLIRSYSNVGILKRMSGKDLSNYIATSPGQNKSLLVTNRFIESMMERIDQGDCLVFCGREGTGKTHLGVAIIKAAMKLNRISSKYITIPEIIRKIRATYKNVGGTVEQFVQEISKIDVLVIDEVGVDAGKEDTTILFDIIDTRYRHQLPTIIISNLNKKDLTDYIGVRTMDRLEEGKGIVVGFDWKSFRRKKT